MVDNGKQIQEAMTSSTCLRGSVVSMTQPRRLLLEGGLGCFVACV
jgi:hypothetical protein